MVKETPSKAASDSDGVGDEASSRRPIRKSAAKAHLAWESEKSKHKSESELKNKMELGPKKPAANGTPSHKAMKSKDTHDAATIPNTSDKEELPIKITKVGPPKKAKHVVKAVDEEFEPEDAYEGIKAVASSNADSRRRHASAGSPSTSSRRPRDNEDEEDEGFEERDSSKETDEGSDEADKDEEEEAEEEEPEDDLARLANNPRALMEKLDAEDARWAKDNLDDALVIKGLMSDDTPTTHSRTPRSSSSCGKQRVPATSPPTSSRKRRTEDCSDGEDDGLEPSPPLVKKTKVSKTSQGDAETSSVKGKAKEITPHKLLEKQRQEERKQEAREEREQQRWEKREKQKLEEWRKERERRLRELERACRALEQADDKDRVRAKQRSQSEKEKKGAAKEKEKGKDREQGQSRNREENGRVTSGQKSVSRTEVNGGAHKKRSRPNEAITWADERETESSKSKHAAKRKRGNEANGKGSELSEVDAGSEIDSMEGSIAPVIRKEGRIRLTDQHACIQRVCTVAIKELLTNICIKNAFLDGPEKSSDFAKSALITAAKSLKYNDIKKKLRSDEDYGSKLASIPVQRVSNLRGKAKKAADPLVPTVFNLEDGDVDKVRWLHDGLRYIYPHNYENNTVDGEKAYNHSIFYQVLRNAFFNKPRSFGFKIADRFESSHPEKPDEKEIPSALLALAATAVFASIEDHRTSRSEVGDFKGNLFIDAYRSNIDVLSEVKSDNIGAYHRLMHDLYCKLMGTSATSVRKSARTFLNTKDMAQ